MDEEKLRQWVEKKLDQGVSEERIKKSLENTGHDPSIVEEIQDPFGEDSPDSDESADQSSTSEFSEPSEDSSLDLGPEPSFQSSDSSQESESESGYQPDSAENGEEGEGRSLPGTTGTPDLSLPHIPLRYMAVLLGVAVAVGGYVLLPAGIVPEVSGDDFDVSMPDIQVPEVNLPDISLSDGDDTADPNGQNLPEFEDAGCDVGIRINSASTVNGGTEVSVSVTRGATDVAVGIYEDGSQKFSTTVRMKGEVSTTVPETGDRAVVHPVDCDEPRDSASIN